MVYLCPEIRISLIHILVQGVGCTTILDAQISNTPIFVRSSKVSANRLTGALVLNNIDLREVPTAIAVLNNPTPVLRGTPHYNHIASWGQGHIFRGTNSQPAFVQADLSNPHKPASLLDGAGRVFGRTHPQYEDYAVEQFVSVRDHGAVGDGVTDDTAALSAVIARFSGEKIIFVDAGTYLVTDTIHIPGGTQIVGEAWSVIMGGGERFGDMLTPHVMVRVGEEGETGVVEITDIIFATKGPGKHALCYMLWVAELLNLSSIQRPERLLSNGTSDRRCKEVRACGIHISGTSVRCLQSIVWGLTPRTTRLGGGKSIPRLPVISQIRITL